MDASLIEKILSGSATTLEKKEFEKWLQESEINIVHYEQLKLIWEKTGRIPNSIHFDENKAMQNIRAKVHRNNVVVRKVKLRRTWMAAAASVLILLGISALGYQQEWINFGNNIEYYAQNSVKEVSLPDGSTVWLNANSTLIAPEKFNGKVRNVKLTGEAYFEVARDESHPFKIKAGKTITKVLGTSFNIKMDSTHNNVSVEVNNGKVAFYQLGHKREGVVLLAGDAGAFEGKSGEINMAVNRDLNYLAWKTHILTFKATPLKEVCEVLSDYYQVHIQTGLSAPHYIITAKFEDEKLDDLLATIQLTLDVKIKKESERIIIYQ